MLKMEKERREALLGAAALRSRRRAAGQRARRAAAGRAVSALRRAAFDGTRSGSRV